MFLEEDFLLLSARAFTADMTMVPDTHGFYCILLKGGDQLLKSAGYDASCGPPPERLRDYHHVYTGMSGQLRTRLKRHFAKDSRVSTFRKTLLAIDQAGKIRPSLPLIGGSEAQLNDWLREHAVIAFKCCPRPDAVVAERRLLERTASPLNITERRKTKFARHLMVLRAHREGRHPQIHQANDNRSKP